ncbi:MAG: hypothetical protein KBT09_00085 [Bacteroidales bacterium]|nr:hypothetical protein [Candidatus Sodaliphilus fimicaballi]
MKNNSHYNYSGTSGISGKRRNKLMRDNEFMEMYLKVLDFMFEMKVSNPRRMAVNYTVLNGKPHYHVSYDRAYNVVRNLLNNNVNPVKPSLQSLMWEEIAGKVKALMVKNDVSIARAVEFVLEHCRASRFFISPEYAYFSIHHKTPLQ